MRRSGKTGRPKERERPEADQLPQRAEQLARAIEEFLRRRAPPHTTPECEKVEPLDWSAGGCEALCALCLLNRALSIYRMRA